MKLHSKLRRRTALKLLASASIASLSGCLGSTLGDTESNRGPITDAAVEETSLVVTLAADATVGHVNVIAPSGDLFGERNIATGVTNASFELGTDYEPGEYRVLAVEQEETVDETTIAIRPEIKIRDFGLYRNNPEKEWDSVYGESSTNTRINGEAFVTLENVGTGPESISRVRFIGDVPNLATNYEGSGIHDAETLLVNHGETRDLYTETFPFGSHISEQGMGCKTDGNRGEFTVVIETQVSEQKLTRTYDVSYSGSESMHDCDVSISEE